jgi:hypothetical protein
MVSFKIFNQHINAFCLLCFSNRVLDLIAYMALVSAKH